MLSDFANPDTTTIGPARLVEIEAEFGTLTPFLLYAEQRWLTTVTAHLDALHEDEPADLPTAGAQLWARLATGRRELRALLDAYADEPTLAAAEARTRRVVMAATGVTAERLRSDNQRAARRRGLRTALIEACGWTRRETPEVA